MRNVQRVLVRVATNFFNWVAFISMSLIVAAVFLQIFFRYVIQSPLFWSEEFAKFMFPWLTFAGAALAVKVSGHISINYFVDRLPKKMQHIINRIGEILSSIFCVLVVLYTIPLAESQKNVNSTALAIPLNYFSLSIVVGVIGIVIFMLWGKSREKEL